MDLQNMSITELFHHLVWVNEILEVGGLLAFFMAVIKNINIPIPHALKHIVKDNEKIMASLGEPHKKKDEEQPPTTIQDGSTLMLTGSLADHTLRLVSELHDAKKDIERLELLLEINNIPKPPK